MSQGILVGGEGEQNLSPLKPYSSIYVANFIVRSFEFDPEASCDGCSKDTKVTVINLGLQVGQ